MTQSTHQFVSRDMEPAVHEADPGSRAGSARSDPYFFFKLYVPSLAGTLKRTGIGKKFCQYGPILVTLGRDIFFGQYFSFEIDPRVNFLYEFLSCTPWTSGMLLIG